MKIGIIGGGIVGSSSAYYLSKFGYKPVVIEKDGVASHASGFAQGGLNPNVNPYSIDFELHQLAWYLHNEIKRDSYLNSFLNPEYVKKNIIFLATKRKEQMVFKTFLKTFSNRISSSSRWLNSNEIRDIDSRVSGKILGGVYYEDYMEVNSLKLSELFLKASLEMGSEYVLGKVDNILIKNGKVVGVEVNGEKKDFDVLLISSGPWSSSLLGKNGISLPLFPLKGQILRIENPGLKYQVAFSWGKNYLTQKEDGLVWIGTTEEKVGFDDDITVQGKEEILNSAEKIFPMIRELNILKQTACLRPVTQDNLPIISETNISGLYIGTGTGRKGIKLGPAIGNLVSRMIIGKDLQLDVSNFSLNRFNGIAKP
jgi:glycine oxidase